MERELFLKVFGWREERMENWWGLVAFSPGPPKTNLSNLERKQERKEGFITKDNFAPFSH